MSWRFLLIKPGAPRGTLVDDLNRPVADSLTPAQAQRWMALNQAYEDLATEVAEAVYEATARRGISAPAASRIQAALQKAGKLRG